MASYNDKRVISSNRYNNYKSFPGDSVVKNLPANAGDVGLISRSGKSPGEGNGNPLQCSFRHDLGTKQQQRNNYKYNASNRGVETYEETDKIKGVNREFDNKSWILQHCF